MPALLDRVLLSTASDGAEDRALLGTACTLTAVFSLAFVALDLWAGFVAGAVVMASASIVFLALPPVLRRTRLAPVGVHLFLLAGVGTVALNATLSGAAAILPWLALAPLAGVLFGGSRAGAAWTVIAVALTAGLGPVVGEGRATVVVPARVGAWTLAIRAGLPLIVCVLALAFQREKERAFRALHQRNDALGDTLRELERAQAQLVQQEKLASLGQLTAGIAHELKNPLNFVTNFSTLNVELAAELRQAVRAGDVPGAEALLDEIAGNAERANAHGLRADAIVRSMTAHARKEGGLREPVDLNALVAEQVAVAACARVAAPLDVAVTIEVAYDEAAGTVEAEREALGRAVRNLLDNALYAARSVPPSPDHRPRVRVETARAGGHVEVRVRDNGPGIPTEARARVFEPFYTTKPAGEGVGLGLSLAYDIVRMRHDGTLAVEGAVGAGALFVLRLPAGARPADCPSPLPAPLPRRHLIHP